MGAVQNKSELDDTNIYPSESVIEITNVEFKNGDNKNGKVFQTNEKKLKAVVHFLGNPSGLSGIFFWRGPQGCELKKHVFSFDNRTSNSWIETFYEPNGNLADGDYSLVIEINGENLHKEEFRVVRNNNLVSNVDVNFDFNLCEDSELTVSNVGNGMIVSHVQFKNDNNEIVGRVFKSNEKKFKAVIYFKEVPAGSRGNVFWRVEKSERGEQGIDMSKYEFSFEEKSSSAWIETYYETDSSICPGNYLLVVESNGKVLHNEPFSITQAQVVVSRVDFKHENDENSGPVFNLSEKKLKVRVYFTEMPAGAKGSILWKVERAEKMSRGSGSGSRNTNEMAKHEYSFERWTCNPWVDSFYHSSAGFSPGEYSVVVELNGKTLHKEPFKIVPV